MDHIDQPTTVSDHVTLPGYPINDLEPIFLELINSNRDGIRKAREAFLISKVKTLEPCGMNRPWHTFLLSIFVNQSYLIFSFVSFQIL